MTKKQIIIFGFLILTDFIGKAQTNLLYDGDFEDSEFECSEEFSSVGINVISNNWFSGIGIGNGTSLFFGAWDTTCNFVGMMNNWDTIPPYQGSFSGWIPREIATSILGNYFSREYSFCTMNFSLETDNTYYLSLIARRPHLRGNPILNYNNFEVVFSMDYEEKIIESNLFTYNPKDTVYQNFYFNKDTIDYELGFVKLDTCFSLENEFNSLCFKFDEQEISPELATFISLNFLPVSRWQSYWIDEVKIFDALEVEGNPCNLENHPENIPKTEKSVLKLPNIFTPNNDGINDYFVPIKAENIEIEKVIIQNRWGQTVFESNEVNWDGNFQGKPTPDGTYFYIITCKDKNEKMKSKSGTITLKR
jgi:gliding motility-associated-like protein